MANVRSISRSIPMACSTMFPTISKSQTLLVQCVVIVLRRGYPTQADSWNNWVRILYCVLQPEGVVLHISLGKFFGTVALNELILYANSGALYRSLSVAMTRYSPSVECHTDLQAPPPLYDSCKEVIDTMQWSETSVRFGYPWQVSLYGYIPLH